MQRVFCCIHLVDSVRYCPTANAASWLSGVKRRPVSMETSSRCSFVSVYSTMSLPRAPRQRLCIHVALPTPSVSLSLTNRAISFEAAPCSSSL